VFAALEVTSIVAEAESGCFGLFEQRLDCVAALVPGILTYRLPTGDVFVAVDSGVLAKIGSLVLVSVRHAIAGPELAALHDSVRRNFLTVDNQERVVRTAVSMMVSDFISRFDRVQHA